jgi:hypothetical protein
MRATGIVPALHGAPLRDCDGVAVGAVEQLLTDAVTHRPAWLVVRLDDGRRTVAPAVRARPSLHGTRVPWPEATVRSCPVTLGGVELDHARALRACRHYGVALMGATRSAQDARPEPGAERHEVAGVVERTERQRLGGVVLQ